MHQNILVENASSMNKLDSLINNKGNVIVLYWASWCGHCIQFKEDWNSFIKISKIDTAQIESAHNGLASSDKHSVSSYPTLKLFTNGKMILFENERTIESLMSFVKKNVKSSSVKTKAKSTIKPTKKTTTKTSTKKTTKKSIKSKK
jgi:thioredoxin 1